jgi:hypothetical protein
METMSFFIARVSRLFFGMASLAALSACGGSSSAPPANNSGTGSGGTTTPAQHLYVANGTQVLQYPLPITSTSTPSVTLSVPASAVAVDSNGSLAVADKAGNLLIYTAPVSNASTPSVMFANASATAGQNGFVAFAPNGDLVASALSLSPGQVSSQINLYTQPFSSGSTISQVVKTTDSTTISGLAVDGSRNLYVSSNGIDSGGSFSDISAFAPPWTGAPVISQFHSAASTVGAVAVSTTQLFICNSGGFVMIDGLPFPNGVGAGLVPINSNSCTGLAADSSGNLYVADRNNPMRIYAPPFLSSSVPIMSLNATGNIAIGK